ncbi:LuxR C-terminal-related transcriptional regulator [Lewinella cohaerens]|uniref:response regulator transcription factor n=1 Tax=Lewinella cohaerens TaxID=70995 RepID=UPI0003695FEF|nr:response regulator transcription factor [Lewinella cohaerens]
MISVAIVTASRSLRTAWQAVVDKMPDARCVGAFATANAIPQEVDGPPIEVILLGIMPKDDGLRLFTKAQSAQADAEILILATDLSDSQFFAVLRSGAAGFISSNSFPAIVQAAIRQLAKGETPLSKDATKRIMDSFRAQRRSDNLSEREQEVYHLLCQGKNYREIAESLFVSQNTVRFHLKNIYKKLDVKSRHEAVARAYELGQQGG